MLSNARRLLSLIDVEVRGRWVVVILLAVLVSVSEVLGTFLIFVLLGLITAPDDPPQLPLVGDARDLFPGTDPETRIIVVALVIAGFFVARGGLYLVQTYVQNRVAQSTGVRLSTRLVRGYLRMPYAEHTKRNSSELLRTAYASVAEIVGGVLVPLTALLSESLIVLGVFASLLFLAPGLTLGAGTVVGLLVLVLVRVVQPKMRRLGTLNQSSVGASIKTLQQTFEGIRDIKVLGRERFFEHQYAQHRAVTARTSYLRAVLIDAPRAVIETSLILLIVAFLVVTVRVSRSPEGALAILGVLAYAVLRVLPSVNRIVANSNSIRFGAAAVELVLQDLKALDTRPWNTSEDAGTLPFRHEIRLAGVDFSYHQEPRPILTSIDMVIKRGESVGIVGATGAGKSTLLNVILGLLPPTKGSVEVDGQDIAADLPAWLRNVGLVPQTVFLIDDSILRNIAIGYDDSDIDEAAVWRAVEIAQLTDFVSSLQDQLDTMVGERGVRLSGGQRQRVAIARALYRNPELLVFDEGTSALDNATEAAFTRALEALKGKRTILTVAHRLSTVRNHDRIVVLDDGRVADVGTFDELVSRSSVFQALAR